jgi:GTP-binding protein
MKITSATFLKTLVGPDEALSDGTPQIAFIGRSNVGKSSVINSLVGQKALARTSHIPGYTRGVNLFFINKKFYLVDLPGYGYAYASKVGKAHLKELVDWYLLDSNYRQKKVVLIIDANVGPTDKDLEMLKNLEEREKDIVVVANKIDKIKKSEYEKKFRELKETIGRHRIIPYSTVEKIGISELSEEIFG